jgi:superkiller protein 3
MTARELATKSSFWGLELRSARRIVATLLAVASCAAAPVRADKRLDDAVKKAEAQLAKGKEAEAVKILQKEAQRAPRDPEPQLALARLYVRLGKLDEAAAPLAKAGELAGAAPTGVRARVRAGQSSFALRAGTAGEALAFARQGVEAQAAPENLAALARAQARLGATLEARETADRALRAAPDSVAVQLALGDALRAACLHAEAAAAYRRALQLEPGSAAAGSGLALALAARGEAAPALEAARTAAQADPHSAEAQAALGLAALAQDPDDKKSEAVAAAYQATSLEPKNPLAPLALGRVFESRGQLDQAAAAYAKAVELDPSWSAPRVAALGVQLKQGDAKGALAGLRALPMELRTSGEAELLLGRLLSQEQEWASALAALDRAVASLPGLAEAHALRGAAAYNAGELQLAADSYGRAAELEPGNLAYQSSRALHLSYDGRREEGLAVMLQATARPDGQQPDAFLQLGGIYRDFRPPRVAEAVAAYEKALTLDPKNGQAALGVALSYRAGQQWARAISAYERVSQKFRRLDGEALLGTAWCYYWSGDDTRAKFYTGLAVRAGADVTDIRQAFSRPPGNAAVAADLAELREGLRSKNAGVQARAVVGLLELGRPGVPALADALQRKGTSLAARERIVEGLGRLGSAAREALPQLERLAKGAPPEAGVPDASEASAALQDREARLAASAQAASAKIRGSSP